MDGVVFGGKDAAKRNIAMNYPHQHFYTLLHDSLWLDGLHGDNPPPGVGGASFANDATYSIGRAHFTERVNNSYFHRTYNRLAPTLPVVFLVAKCDIAPGEEITVHQILFEINGHRQTVSVNNYGRGFWKRFEDDQLK